MDQLKLAQETMAPPKRTLTKKLLPEIALQSLLVSELAFDHTVMFYIHNP